jgi:hypothetical protein
MNNHRKPGRPAKGTVVRIKSSPHALAGSEGAS